MNNFANLRAKANLTQEAVAKELHINRSTVAKWETGKSWPKAKLVPKLSALYRCSADDLFSPLFSANDAKKAV